MHTILIVIHTITGLSAFVAGIWLVYNLPDNSSPIRLFQFYLISLVTMAVSVVAAIIVDWRDLATLTRLIFSVLGLLMLYMIFRAVQAHSALESKNVGWRSDFIEHIGFTLISLFVGFVLVGAMDLGFPGWLVTLGGVLAVLIGREIVSVFKQRMTPLSFN